MPRNLVNYNRIQKEEKMKWTKILCPVDFSTVSMEALKLAGDLAEKFGAGLVVVHVLEPILAPTDFSFGPLSMTDVEDKLSDRAMDGLEKAAQSLPLPKDKVQINVARGIGSQEIIRIAEETKVDLIVMGTHGYTGITHALLGSTAERVVRRSPCPVLTIKGKGETAG
jgi:nucleotide-binding universal stress UspA family protein